MSVAGLKATLGVGNDGSPSNETVPACQPLQKGAFTDEPFWAWQPLQKGAPLTNEPFLVHSPTNPFEEPFPACQPLQKGALTKKKLSNVSAFLAKWCSHQP
jgi:hypothetical protein